MSVFFVFFSGRMIFIWNFREWFVGYCMGGIGFCGFIVGVLGRYGNVVGGRAGWCG